MMNTAPDGSGTTPADSLLAGFPTLRLDNSDLSPDEAAVRILEWLTQR